jgi:uncharacterized membrane protein YhaH (DUF805 family)
MPEYRMQMTVGEALFSFEGRISRPDFWLKGVLPLLTVELIISGFANCLQVDKMNPMMWIVGLVLLWPNLAILVKRLHDHNYSVWFLLTIFIPVVGVFFMIWLWIKIWFLRGTVGRNRFGEDPLGSEYVAEALEVKQKISG